MKDHPFRLLCIAVALCAIAGIISSGHTHAQMQAHATGPKATPSGTLYEDHTGTNVVITTAGTYYPWITATAGPMVAGMTADVTDANGDHLIVPIAGTYLVLISGAFTGGNDDQARGRVALSGTGSVVVVWERTLGAAARIGSASAQGLIAATAGQELRMEFTSNTNSDTLVLHNVQLSATRVGP